ncbi:hypothetical protein [Desulfopila aestuarii]|uniref:Uncharacterized protein n=1 Tax=Desulfopila aestuarii DSM 18488 TaxID=1121416 RepID=A0A1M7YGK5_9BACT|nr:hypothetical protein [Desulfopila aestuarii]SHO51750.1 hypothetical protein SAMN02745220_04207 [Desulfopila aestuarii DSM 18488]
MEKTQLQALLATVENHEKYKDLDALNGSLRGYSSPASLLIQDGKFYLKKNSTSPLVELGDEIMVSIFAGIPAIGLSRAFFANGYSGGQTRPDCFSPDGITAASSNPVSASCRSCPNSQWGSGANSVGTACRASKNLILLLLKDEEEPDLVTLRISGKSITNLQRYVSQFEEQSVAVYKFATNLTLDHGSKYPVVEFEVVNIFVPEELKELKRFLDLPEVQEHLNR